MSTKFIRLIFPLLITGLLILIAMVDCWLLPDLSLELIYLLPILLSAMMGRWYAFGSCLVAVLLVRVTFENKDAPWIIDITGSSWELLTLIGFYLTVAMLASALKSFYAQIIQLTTRDSQTGLLNQSTFMEHLASEKNRAARFEKHLSIAYLDLDNFKAINDTCGHAFGDVILKSFGNLLKISLRDYDLSARLGGDEFAILLPETNTEDARQIVQRLQEKFTELQIQELKESAEKSTKLFPATFSAGVVTYQTPQLTAEEMIHAADTLMYEAKKMGKNQISVKSHQSETVTINQ